MIKKIILIFTLCLFLLINCVNAYFNFENTFDAFSLTRNKVPATALVSYSNLLPSNQDVEVNIEFDKVISIIGDTAGMRFSEDGKKLIKTVTENESNTLLIRDEDYNYQEVIYNVDWIDKEPPVITGAENGEIYNQDIHLDYSDNVGVKDIYADYYSDSFSIYTVAEDFYELTNIQIFPSNRNSITAYVLSNTKQMEKYNYYLDGVLYATTHDKKYTFIDIEYSEQEHQIVVEALDRYGNVIAREETKRKTIPINKIYITSSNGIKYVTIKGAPSNMTKISGVAWVYGHADSYYNFSLLNDAPGSYVGVWFLGNHKGYYGRYYMKIEMQYKENGENKNVTLKGSADMPDKYKEADYSKLPNDFTENGKYYVRCSDEAGNESEIEFEIRK